jgi:hypothetical protein
MFIKKFLRQHGKFRNFSIVCLLLLIVYFLLFLILNDRTKFRSVIYNFSIDTQNSQNNKCILQECTTEQSKKHGDLFASFQDDWSSCYSDFYLTAFDNHDIPVEVLIDVGANKVYTVATWLAFFLPELGINQARLGQYINSIRKLFGSCGSCNDCKDKPLQRNNTSHKIKLQIHAFEPQPGTVDMLKDIQNWMNISRRSDSTFEVHGMAVSE